MRKGDKISKLRSREHREKLSLAMRGNTNQKSVHSINTKNKISQSMKGNQNTKGIIHNATMRLKCRLAKLAEKNPAWMGGKSLYPYTEEWTPHLKADIRQRDKHTCQLCGLKTMRLGILHIHHIDYDKRNNTEENLITLCHSCHSKTNHHRNEWGIYNGQFCRNESNVRNRYEGSPRIVC